MIKAVVLPADWEYSGITCAFHYAHGSHYFVGLTGIDGYPGIKLSSGNTTFKYNAFVTLYDKMGNKEKNIIVNLPHDNWWELHEQCLGYSKLEAASGNLYTLKEYEMTKAVNQLLDRIRAGITTTVKSIVHAGEQEAR